MSESIDPPVPPAAPDVAETSPEANATDRSAPSRTRRILGARSGLVVGVIAAVLVGGGAGAGIALAATSGGDSPKTTTAAATTKGGATGKHGSHKATVGTITAQGATSWTIRTAAGATVTVKITSTTRFGTHKRPAVRSQFHPGSKVVVAGKDTAGTIVAKIIAAPSSPASPASPKSSTKPSTSATASAAA